MKVLVVILFFLISSSYAQESVTQMTLSSQTEPECNKYIGGPFVYRGDKKFSVTSCRPTGNGEEEVKWTVVVTTSESLVPFNKTIEVLGKPDGFILQGGSLMSDSLLEITLSVGAKYVDVFYFNSSIGPRVIRWYSETSPAARVAPASN